MNLLWKSATAATLPLFLLHTQGARPLRRIEWRLTSGLPSRLSSNFPTVKVTTDMAKRKLSEHRGEAGKEFFPGDMSAGGGGGDEGSASLKRQASSEPKSVELGIGTGTSAAVAIPVADGAIATNCPERGELAVLPPIPIPEKGVVTTVGVVGHPVEAIGKSGTVIQQVLKAVVKVFCTSTSPNYSMPWQMKHQQKSTGSGFAIEGRRILTNAHAIAHQALVMVRKHGNPKKFVAKVLAVGHECDIALMTVEDDDFWDGMLHLTLGHIPELQEVVTVVGYPTGGDNVSVTKGVVSRLEIQQYVHASYHLLAIQIDAAINSGNSGGPALKDDKVIGIAFESLTDAENIGYIIPVPVITHFLQDVERHGRYTGFCDMGIFWQNMENVDMRTYYKMAKDQSGVLVSKVQPLSPVNEVMKAGDILMAFDGVPIADDGTIPFREAERIEFRHLVSMKYADDICRVKLLRDGKVYEVETLLGCTKPLVPVHLYDLEGLPSFYIIAGLVFVQCSQPFLRNQYGKDWEMKAPLKLCERSASGILEHADQEAVLLTQVLAAEINTGYQNLANILVNKCNGVEVRNIQQLAKLVMESKDNFLVVDLDKDKRIIIDLERARNESDSILQQNCIPFAYPPDLMTRCPGASNNPTAALTKTLKGNSSGAVNGMTTNKVVNLANVGPTSADKTVNKPTEEPIQRRSTRKVR